MTIAHVGSTGGTASAATAARGTTSISVAYPASSVAAGRIALIFAEGKLSTATWGTNPSGYTKIVDTTGGTGSNGADTGPVRIGVWYKILTGSESGSETVALTGGTQVTAVMSVYSKTATNWVPPNANTGFVTGQDSSSGTNISAALGSWPTALRSGDWVVAAFASTADGNGSAQLSSPTITQSGATFGTVTYRNRLSGSDGNDGTIFTWDASVTTGNENAPTIGATWAITNSGAGAAIRLREVSNVAISTVNDNFNDNSPDATLWTTNYGTTSETGGRARVETSTTYAGYFSEPKFSIDSTGTWAQVFPAAVNGATTEAYTAMWLISPSQTLGTDFGIAYEATTGEIGFTIRTGYAFDGATVSLTYNATDHAWWRIRYSSPNIIWETSPDGSTWTQRRSASAPAYVANTIDFAFLFESHRAEGTTNFAEMDNWNVVQSVTHNGDAALTVQSNLSVSAVVTTFGTSALSDDSSLTAAGTLSRLGTAGLTVQSNLTATGSNTVQASSGLTIQSGLTATAIKTSLPTIGLTVQSSLAVTEIVTKFATAALTIQSGLSATGSIEQNGSAVLTGQSNLIAVGSNTVVAVASLSSQSAMSATAVLDVRGTSTLTGQSGLIANSIVSTTGASALTVQSNLSATGSIEQNGSATLTAQSNLAATGSLEQNAEAVLTGQSNLISAGTVSRLGIATLTVQSNLTATGTLTRFGSTALTVQANLAATGSNTVQAASVLSGQSTLSSDGFASTTGIAALTVQSNLTAEGTIGAVPVTVTMTAQSNLIASGFVTKTGNSVLSAQSNLAVTGSVTELASASLAVTSNLVTNGLVTVISGAINPSVQSALVATGTVTKFGIVTLSAESTLNSQGSNTVQAISSLSEQFSFTVAGVITQFASASLLASLNLNANSILTRFGSVSLIQSSILTVLIVIPDDYSSLSISSTEMASTGIQSRESSIGLIIFKEADINRIDSGTELASTISSMEGG